MSPAHTPAPPLAPFRPPSSFLPHSSLHTVSCTHCNYSSPCAHLHHHIVIFTKRGVNSNLAQRQGSETRLNSLYDAFLPLSSPFPGHPHTPKRTLTVGRVKPPCDSHPPDSHCRPRATILQRRYLWQNGGGGVGIVREGSSMQGIAEWGRPCSQEHVLFSSIAPV